MGEMQRFASDGPGPLTPHHTALGHFCLWRIPDRVEGNAEDGSHELFNLQHTP